MFEEEEEDVVFCLAASASNVRLDLNKIGSCFD